MKSHYRILFIDDTEADHTYLRLLIEIHNLPINPHFELSGKAALQYLNNVSSEDFPEVIFVDINMPLMSGFEFIETFKENYEYKQNQAVLYVMSSSHRLSEIEKAKSIPLVKDFISKPLTKEVFEKEIVKVLETQYNT